MYESINYEPVKFSGCLGVGTVPPPDILFVQANPGREVIRITNTGEVYWNQRLVETDEDFKLAMLDLANAFKERWL